MGTGHHHGATDHRRAPVQPPLARRTSALLLGCLALVLISTGAGLVMLWPHGAPAATTAAGRLPGSDAPDVSPAHVVTSSATTCKGESADRLPDGSIPATATCASIVARIDSGPEQGRQVTVAIPAQVYRAGIDPGDGIELARYSDEGVWAWVDFSRGLPLGLLAVVFAALVVGVARLRGLASLGGLALAYLAIVRFTLPALREGESAVAVALVTSIAVMTVVLYLAHGVSLKTTTALLGTVFGLALTAGLASWAAAAAHLNGLNSEENHTISQLTDNRDLSGIILCGIIIAGLGVLNDVTVTQASAVWELHAHAPGLGVRGLFGSGMRVGRDHLASTVYTIAFAYAGAALPTIILIDLYGRPLSQVITSGQIAEEVVRTLVGSIGLILAIPVTTLIASLAVGSGSATRFPQRRDPVGSAVEPTPRRIPGSDRDRRRLTCHIGKLDPYFPTWKTQTPPPTPVRPGRPLPRPRPRATGWPAPWCCRRSSTARSAPPSPSRSPPVPSRSASIRQRRGSS